MTPTHKTSERQGPALDVAAIEQAGLRYMARYAASSAHLRQVLLRRVRRDAASPEAALVATASIDILVQGWLKSGLLNDARYAETKAAGLHRRGASARQIASRLAKSGVARAYTTAALSEYDTAETPAPRPGGDLAAAIAFARRRRLGPYSRAGRGEPSSERDLAIFARAGFMRPVADRILSASDEQAVEELLLDLSESGA